MNDQLTIGILLAILLALSLTALLLRFRKNKKVKPRRIERVAGRTSVRKEKKEEPVMPFFSVDRPGIFVWKAETSDQASLFIQRAQKNDEDHYGEIFADAERLEPFSGLFARAVALLCEPCDGLSEGVYSVNFSKSFEENIESVASGDFRLQALSLHGRCMGTALSSPSDFCRGATIVELFGIFREYSSESGIEKLLKKESALFESHFAKASLLIAPDILPLWEERVKDWEEQFRLSFSSSQASDFEKMESSAALESFSLGIDARLATLASSMNSVREADTAVTETLRLIIEKETLIRLRILHVLLFIVRTDNYLLGLQALSSLRKAFSSFPTVDGFLGKAREYGFERIEKEGRTLAEEEIQLLNQLSRDAEELQKTHARAYEALCRTVDEITAFAENELIHSGNENRYAVRIDGRGELSALLLLERY